VSEKKKKQYCEKQRILKITPRKKVLIQPFKNYRPKKKIVMKN
jgi:hypothetical protein